MQHEFLVLPFDDMSGSDNCSKQLREADEKKKKNQFKLSLQFVLLIVSSATVMSVSAATTDLTGTNMCMS